MLQPNQRCLSIEMRVEMGSTDKSCPLTQYLLSRKSGSALVESDFTLAADIYYGKKQSRYLMEAMLLAPDSTTERICDTMRVRKETVDQYKTYFFDTSVFRNNFDLVDYISELKDDKDRIIKRQALTEGFSFIFSNISGTELNLSAIEVCKRVQSFAYHMMSQARGAVITSDTAKEAKNWANIVKTFTDTLAKKEAGDSDGFLADFKVVFTSNENFPELKEIAGEIIHG
jgi:hypothetical protein